MTKISAWGKHFLLLLSCHYGCYSLLTLLLHRDVSVQGTAKLYEDSDLSKKAGTFSEKRTFVRARNPYSFSSSKGSKSNPGSSPDTDDEDYKLSLRADISGAVLFDDESQIYYAGVSNFDEDTTIAFGKNELPILGGTGQHIGAVGTVKFSKYEEDDEYYYYEDDCFIDEYYYSKNGKSGGSSSSGRRLKGHAGSSSRRRLEPCGYDYYYSKNGKSGSSSSRRRLTGPMSMLSDSESTIEIQHTYSSSSPDFDSRDSVRDIKIEVCLLV